MRDLRNEMYASSIDDDNNTLSDSKSNTKEFVTKEEFNRVIKSLERKIALLESKIVNVTGSGWDYK